jgi:hypothetical protein
MWLNGPYQRVFIEDVSVEKLDNGPEDLSVLAKRRETSSRKASRLAQLITQCTKETIKLVAAREFDRLPKGEADET